MEMHWNGLLPIQVIGTCWNLTGLGDLASASGYTKSSIRSCSQFQRTHQFIMEVWEALYRAMLTQYMAHQSEDLLDKIAKTLQKLPDKAFWKSLTNIFIHMHVQFLTSTWSFSASFSTERWHMEILDSVCFSRCNGICWLVLSYSWILEWPASRICHQYSLHLITTLTRSWSVHIWQMYW